ncbi:MAG: hypothetical protein NT028_10645 [candidate division Zixibacteria bacterium]|nr:hypothetical protein [candidate division Zixibacteria bacterium]
MKLFYDKTAITTMDDARSHYAADEFASPTRSTVASLSWLEHEISALDSLLKELEMPDVCDLHLEYTVEPRQGDGEASHTDLMVISGESSLAVEVKWTEPRYDTVGKWLTKGPNPLNRCKVLTGWLGLLQKHAMHELYIEDFSGAVYQMVHRAASACAVGKMPRLAYLVFKPSPDPRTADIQTIHKDLTNLWSLLGNPKGFPFYLVEVHLSPTAAYKAIESLPKRDKATAEQVKAALFGSDRLFKFGKYHLTKVGAKIMIPTGYGEDALVDQRSTVPGVGKV